MFGPPFTLPKVIALCALAVVLWGYFFWQMRSQWVKNRRRREFMAEGGLRPQRRSFDRRKMLQIVFIGVLVLAGGLMAYFDRFGTPSARDLLHLVEVRVAVVMKYLGGVVVA